MSQLPVVEAALSAHFNHDNWISESHEVPEYLVADAAMKADALAEDMGEARPRAAIFCEPCAGRGGEKDTPPRFSYSTQSSWTRCPYCQGRGWVLPMSEA